MALHITPDTIEATYELLRLTPPFRRWKLPHADDVEFHVIENIKVYGQYCFDTVDPKKRTIRVSCSTVRSLNKLVETLAHEMCHMREHQLKVRADVQHGRVFQKLADQVCQHHGFDRGQF
jgi:hypothetical protein